MAVCLCARVPVCGRADTIVDADMVLVMDGGRVGEYGSPYDLLQQHGLFARLIAVCDCACPCECVPV